MKALRLRLSSSTASADSRPLTTPEAERLSQTLTLRSGRVLGYSEYGNPTGFPLFYFHGFPSSRLEGWNLGEIPQRHGLRVIAPDRPGFGLSSFQAGRGIADWPGDVQALASHLSLSRFAVLGVSGGGPYAVACAHGLPHDMLSAVGVVAGSGPWIAGTQDVTLSRRLISLAATHCPAAFIAISNIVIAVLRRTAATGMAKKWLDNWIDRTKRREEEKEEEGNDNISTQEARERLIKASFEAFTQGSGAFVQEARLLSHDWGFRFEDIAFDKVQMWHGTKDRNAPLGMMRYMAERLPHAVLHELDEDHYSIGHHIEKILSELVPAEATDKSDQKAS